MNESANTMPPVFLKKKIGKTTYVVRVHFSQTATETFDDKIRRMLKSELQKT